MRTGALWRSHRMQRRLFPVGWRAENIHARRDRSDPLLDHGSRGIPQVEGRWTTSGATTSRGSLESHSPAFSNGSRCQRKQKLMLQRCAKSREECSQAPGCCAQAIDSCGDCGECGENASQSNSDNECAPGYSCVGKRLLGGHGRCRRNRRKPPSNRRGRGEDPMPTLDRAGCARNPLIVGSNGPVRRDSSLSGPGCTCRRTPGEERDSVAAGYTGYFTRTRSGGIQPGALPLRWRG